MGSASASRIISKSFNVKPTVWQSLLSTLRKMCPISSFNVALLPWWSLRQRQRKLKN